jgi:hypothetical protein
MLRNLGNDLLKVAGAMSPQPPVSGIGSSLGTASLLYAEPTVYRPLAISARTGRVSSAETR